MAPSGDHPVPSEGGSEQGEAPVKSCGWYLGLGLNPGPSRSLTP